MAELTPAERDTELEHLIKRSKELVAKMTPEEHAAMIEKQKQSFLRSGMRCEHGVFDFEQCPKCRGWE